MKVVNKILGYFLAFLVGIMVLACVWQVVTRFILGNPSQWTEEFLRYALIWLTMIGAPYAYGMNKQLSLTFITGNFTEKNKIITKLVVEVLVLILSVSVLIVGGIMVTNNSAGQISAAMQIPMQVYYACVPISGCFMVIYCVERLIQFTKELKEER